MIQVFDAPYVLLALLAALAGLASLGQQRRLKKKYVPIRIDDNKNNQNKRPL
ncbi:hypothetical protein HBN50_08255 [Halobacteriovorax sp. GB3]|uniref:hypothetical protein n=1 Tax=Halobacteriovorax sp. GB3 TaxID=2719615 RepID=UPI00235DE59D|nr:hypothetical protein [Halobacteriovorax sp. GB3]MDD0853085.1 hypothetical protein [Halobacteriovorax sp. GB3]